eukprot:6205263-Pleurochrysis_carterae.AAC.2
MPKLRAGSKSYNFTGDIYGFDRYCPHSLAISALAANSSKHITYLARRTEMNEYAHLSRVPRCRHPCHIVLCISQIRHLTVHKRISHMLFKSLDDPTHDLETKSAPESSPVVCTHISHTCVLPGPRSPTSVASPASTCRGA